VHTLTGHVKSVAVSADAGVAVSGGYYEVEVWDLSRGTCLHTLTGPRVKSVERPDGRMAIGQLESVAVSADGCIAVSGRDDGTVLVWDLKRWKCVRTLTGHTDVVQSVAVSADGRIAVSGDWEGKLRVWDLSNGHCLHTLTGHTEKVLSVAVSPDGRVAATSSSDTTARVWELGTGTRLQTLTGHTNAVKSVAVSADAHIAVTGSDDETVRAWVLDWDYEFEADHSPAGTTKRQQTSSTRRWWKLK
jgi:WD40 repeat protein